MEPISAAWRAIMLLFIGTAMLSLSSKLRQRLVRLHSGPGLTRKLKQVKAVEYRQTEFEKTTSKKIKRHLVK